MNDHAWTPIGIAIVLALLILSLSGCGGAPQRTIPKGAHYPTKLRPQLPFGVIPMADLRCLGGGIGGCTLGGKPE